MRAAVIALVAACSAPAVPAVHDTPPRAAAARTITLIGTNDLHGALERLPLFAGFVANARAARAADGGGVLLVDAGDMFQGTLESNLGEGADVVRAYNQLGYAASAVGNHEFDYGPIGPAVTVQGTGEDPRGALKQRASEARFPLLVSNILDETTGKRIDWPNMPAATLVEIAGEKIGIIGASTRVTPTTTMPANFAGLTMAPAAAAIVEQAKLLRGRGAQIIIVTAHIGSKCKDLEHHDDISTCDVGDEVFKLVDELPPHAVDAIVAGHTHAGMAQWVKGIAVIESYSSGRAFGRLDLDVDPSGRLIAIRIFAPTEPCPIDREGNPAPVATCRPPPYEGRQVVADAAVQKIVDEALARAGERRKEKLGVTLTGTVTRAYRTESDEGDLFCDLMLAARPDAQIALANGGGLRADLPAGELTYGQLFEAIPFDNRFAILDVTGAQLKKLVASNLRGTGGIFSWGGLSAKARCKDDKLDVQVAIAGKPLVESKTYAIVTSDFLASGGDGVIGRLGLPPGAIHATDTIIRDAMADVLRKHKTIDPAKLSTPKRLDYLGSRPVSCGNVEQEP